MKTRYRNRILGLLLGGIMAVSLFAGCGKASEPESGKTAQGAAAESAAPQKEESEPEDKAADWESEPVVLKATIVDYATCGYFEQAMNRFTQMHPNVTF